jgi:hypothetical protein
MCVTLQISTYQRISDNWLQASTTDQGNLNEALVFLKQKRNKLSGQSIALRTASIRWGHGLYNVSKAFNRDAVPC